MTAREIGEKIIIWWRLEYDLAFMALWVTMLYAPLTVPNLLVIIRKYRDRETENTHPVAGEVTWHDQ
jgi:hypothetical protein